MLLLVFVRIRCPEQSEKVKQLADACQLFSNVHYSISTHRKYKIIPLLNPDCKKVAKTLEIDKFLFNKNFAEAVKNEQTVKKASNEFKKKAWQPINVAGPSNTRTGNQHLNYQRGQYRGKMKEKRREGRRPENQYRRQTGETKRYYHHKK